MGMGVVFGRRGDEQRRSWHWRWLAAQACLLAMLGGGAFAQSAYHVAVITPPNAPGAKATGAANGRQVVSGADLRPYLLSGGALSAESLHPVSPLQFDYAQVTAVSGDGQQCGYGRLPSWLGAFIHPIAWSGTAASAIDLQPASTTGFTHGRCTGVDGGVQVGFAENNSIWSTAAHAFLWRGSAASAVDLHPAGPAIFSRAMGVGGGEQVGYVSSYFYPDAFHNFQGSYAYPYGEYPGYHTTSRAVRWTGTAASAVSLHPAGFDASEALATDGVQQGGWGYIASDVNAPQHALLWTGDGSNVVDLHPAGFTATQVRALANGVQVGDGWVGEPYVAGSVRHALVWFGTPESMIDLNVYLPAGFTQGVATGVDASGAIVGYGFNTVTDIYEGEWARPGQVALRFVPGPAQAHALVSVALDRVNIAPNELATGTVVLGGPAPAGGVTISFADRYGLSTVTPPDMVVPEGATRATFQIQAPCCQYTFPVTTRYFASDGELTYPFDLTVTPVVTIAGVTGNTVEGGTATSGLVSLAIPAQAGGAVIALASGDPSLVTLPTSVVVQQYFTTATVAITTAPVRTTTSVPITATFNGATVAGTVTLLPPAPSLVTGLTAPGLFGGTTATVTVTLNKAPLFAEGATVSLVSSDTGLVQVPPSVVVAQGSLTATFTVTPKGTSVVKTAVITASLNGSAVSVTVTVNPTPSVSILAADYDTATGVLKIHADTSYAGSVLTFGVDGGAPMGTLAYEAGSWKAAVALSVAPKTVTVWNNNGGQATAKVTVKTATGGGGVASTYKVSISLNGKGTVTSNPAGSSFAPGTTVTLTATPASGSPWLGWSGDCTGTATTCTLVMNADKKVTANFR